MATLCDALELETVSKTGHVGPGPQTVVSAARVFSRSGPSHPKRPPKSKQSHEEIRCQTMAAIFHELDHHILSLSPTPITPMSQKKINTLAQDFPSPLPTPTVLSFSAEDIEACSSTVITPQRPEPRQTGLDYLPCELPPGTRFSAAPLDTVFQTHLEMRSRHKWTVLSDEVGYLLGGAQPELPAEQRAAALQQLTQWLGDKRQANTHLRMENKVSELLSVACAFDPRDPILARQCILVLLHIVRDPSNHLFVGVEVWSTFLRVLQEASATRGRGTERSTSESCARNAVQRQMSRPAKACRLKRKRSFWGMIAEGPCVPASNAVACGDTELQCLALAGLAEGLVTRSQAIVAQEGEAGLTNTSGWQLHNHAHQFAYWFAGKGGYDVLCESLQRCLRIWKEEPAAESEGASAGAHRLALACLHLLELLTCHASSTQPSAPSSLGDTTRSTGQCPQVPRRLFHTLVDMLAALAPHTGCAPQARMGGPVVEILRVVINMCALDVHGPPSGPCGSPLKERPWRLKPLLESGFAFLVSACHGEDVDVINCCLCLFTNIAEQDPLVRHELSQLTARGEGLIPFLVRLFNTRLACGTTADNIVASYTALLLGCLTIDHPGNRDAVCRALTVGTAGDAAPDRPRPRGRRASRVRQPAPVAESPMVHILVVLQEFLLFQSKARVLTHSTLRGLHRVMTAVATANQISWRQS